MITSGKPRGFDIGFSRLLAETDALHGTTTRKLCERAFKLYGDVRFERLAGISSGHLYNLRQHKTYQAKRGSFDKTRPTKINIGERRKPCRMDAQAIYARTAYIRAI